MTFGIARVLTMTLMAGAACAVNAQTDSSTRPADASAQSDTMSTAAADDTRRTQPSWPSAMGIYTGISLGNARVNGACEGSGISFTGCDKSELAWKALLGFQTNQWLSWEAAYIDFGERDFSGQRNGLSVSGSDDNWGVSAHAVGHIPFPIRGVFDGRLSVIGKVGGIYWKADRDASFGSQSDEDVDFSFGAGLQLTLNERLMLRAEWERFNDVGIAGAGRSNVNMWTAGIAYKF